LLEKVRVMMIVSDRKYGEKRGGEENYAVLKYKEDKKKKKHKIRDCAAKMKNKVGCKKNKKDHRPTENSFFFFCSF
jgi:hypothetical protein